MTQFIVHVGPHKTGSTYLQECLARNRPQLAERGIHFPTIWGPVAHHALNAALHTIPNPKLEAQFEKLHAEQHRTVLISVEGLTGLPEASVAYFAKLIGPENPLRCIYYVRAWCEVIPSQWKEEVKGGETDTLPEYLYRRMQNPANSYAVNFGPSLRNWIRHFGPDALRIVAYNPLVASKRDLFTHFAEHFLGWSDAPKPDAKAANVSPDAADIEVIRAIGSLERLRVGHVLPRGYAGAFARRYSERKPALVTPRIEQALAEHKSQIAIDEGMPALLTLQRELLAEFGPVTVPPRLPNFFFRPRRAAIPYIHGDWLLADGVLAEVKAIHAALRAEVEASGRRPDGTMAKPRGGRA